MYGYLLFDFKCALGYCEGMKYQHTKTIRFRAEPNDLAKKLIDALSAGGDVKELFLLCRKVTDSFADIFLVGGVSQSVEGESRSICFRKNRKVRYGWLRTYTKNDFYKWYKKDDRIRKYELGDIDYLKGEFARWFDEWDKLAASLDALLSLPEENQKKRREFAMAIRSLRKRNNFEFIKAFAGAIADTQNSDVDEKVSAFKELLAKTEDELKKCEQAYLPSQSAGVLLTKATLNYHTMNKSPKEYGDMEKRKEAELKGKIGWSEFSFDPKIYFGEDSLKWTLEDAYQEIKKWKAEQKSKFNEDAFGKKLTKENFRTEYPIFEATAQEFDLFLERTEKIQELAEKINKGEKNLEGELKKLRQERGYFFNSPDNRNRDGQIIITEKYYRLCEIYKKIARKRGQILAQTKGFEAEKVDSARLEHWALIFEKSGKNYAMMVPRGEHENHKKAKEFIEKARAVGGVAGGGTMYYFKSLTLRALWKLCFKETKNTFFHEVAQELGFSSFNSENEQKIKGLKHELGADFYQKALQTNALKKKLDIVDFGGLDAVLKKRYEKLEEFESDLEKTCYVKIPIKISEEQEKHFIAEFDVKVFEIASYDLRIKNEAKEGGEKHEEKEHTKLWREFWSAGNQESGHSVRLNPELGVFYREVDEELQTRVSSGKIPKPKYLSEFRNRYRKEQFTLAATITLNATQEKSNLAWKTTEDITRNIDAFNENFRDTFKSEWHYGIDRGRNELATLCAVKFSGKTYSVGAKNFPAPEFAEIEVWKLKDEKQSLPDERGITRKVINNISYFIDKDELFEKTTTASIDLTATKLIKGKIVLNGDVKTYLNLKELSAKRKMFELFSQGKIGAADTIKHGKVFSIAGYAVYFCTTKQKGDAKEQRAITEMLFGYLGELRAKNAREDEISVEKINHLRDAITANITGIIVHLQKTYPGSGIIALENMERKEHIEKHFYQSNQNISRRLEWAMYRRFQAEGLVPPQIKQSVFIREEFKKKKFGIVEFTEMENTSQNCPRCENTHEKTEIGGEYHYVCEKCGFCSQNSRLEFESLDDADKVAAFNIAKNSFYGK